LVLYPRSRLKRPGPNAATMNMPRHQVAEDLREGTLVELDLPEKPGAHYTLSATWRRDARPGPATSWVIDAMRDALAQCPD